MHHSGSQSEFKKPYEPPTVVEVHVDPQQELLQATACAFQAGQNASCNASPGV